MWTCLNRPCLVLTRLRSATRLVTKGCYSTNSKDTCQDDKEGDEAPPKLSYPFYGKGKATAEGDEADKCVGKSYLSGSRYYVFAGSGGGKYKLPSVTSVIVSTKPKSSEFALKNWRNNLIEKHGEKGFEAIRRETISRGAVFHKHVEQWLLRKKREDSSEGGSSTEENETVTRSPPRGPNERSTLQGSVLKVRTEDSVGTRWTTATPVAPQTVFEDVPVGGSRGDAFRTHLGAQVGIGRRRTIGGASQEELLNQPIVVEQDGQGVLLRKLASQDDEHVFPDDSLFLLHRCSAEKGSHDEHYQHYYSHPIAKKWSPPDGSDFGNALSYEEHHGPERSENGASDFTESLHKHCSSDGILAPEKDILDTPTVLATPTVIQNHRYKMSIQDVVEEITDIKVTEGFVHHQELGYAGMFDCLASYRGKLCVIDWKTSKRPKPHLKDLYQYPVQAAAYAGAINNDPNYPFTVSHILIVVAYSDGAKADAHLLGPQECDFYWGKWLEHLHAFKTSFAHDLYN